MTDQPKLKCYYVWDDPDEGGVLVHAETPGKAKQAARGSWMGFDGSEFINLKAKREPTLDSLPINLKNASTVLTWWEFDDDGEEIIPFKDDAEFWTEHRCRCSICEACRKEMVALK